MLSKEKLAIIERDVKKYGSVQYPFLQLSDKDIELLNDLGYQVNYSVALINGYVSNYGVHCPTISRKDNN